MPEPYSRSKLNLNTPQHLALRLGFPLNEILYVSEKVSSFYKFKQEPKKSGGFREISMPYPRLKKIQSAIHKLLTEISVSDAAHGSIKKRSNLTNAKVHCNTKQVINFDITNFFPNIPHYRVYNLFHRILGCSPPVASILTKLSTVNSQVPQGGPMSPDIANLVLRIADQEFLQIANKFNLKYTRYIDDMTFSGAIIPDCFIELVGKIISRNGLRLNKNKEQFMKNGMAQQVTGLNVNRKKPTVPRVVRREVMKENYVFTKFEANSLDEATRYSKSQKIKGRLAYIDYINKN